MIKGVDLLGRICPVKRHAHELYHAHAHTMMHTCREKAVQDRLYVRTLFLTREHTRI